MLSLLVAFAISAAVSLCLVHYGPAHARWLFDHQLGPQRSHASPVPRVGGVAVVIGLIAAAAALWHQSSGGEAAALAGTLLLCGLPAFVVGLAEDVTKRVRPRWRLAATVASALLAVWLLDAVIARTDLWGLDWLASFGFGAVFLAVFSVAGIANAINIIDGFNGLASMCVVMMLLSFAYVAGQVGDGALLTLALLGAGAVLGFFVWNYPAGRIFLGDGGAYFLGFFVAELGILLLLRNPDVSPLCPLLMAIYPVFETLFSMYRRHRQGRAVGVPDGVHLHMLIYKRLMRRSTDRDTAKAVTRRNSMTSPYLWLLCMLSIVPALVWWDDSRTLGIFIVLFGITYTALYWRIVRFKSPRWMVSGHRRGQVERRSRIMRG